MKCVLAGLGLLLAAVALPAAARAGEWSDIDCSGSKLAVTGFSNVECQRGPDWTSNSGCVAENFLAWNSSVTLQLTVIRTGKNCLVKTSPDLDYEIRSYFPATSNATDWSNYRQISGATGANMRNRGHDCFDFYKTGPERNSGDEKGFAWVVHGLFCAPGPGSLDDQAVGSFIDGIVVKE